MTLIKTAMRESVLVSGRHRCEGDLPVGGWWRQGVSQCQENDKGEFWVSNGECGSQVNFCPYCGARAPHQVPAIPYYRTTGPGPPVQ